MKIQFLGIYVWHSGALLIKSVVKMVGIKKPRIVQNFNTLLLSVHWFSNQNNESIPENNEMFFCLSEDGRKDHLVKTERSPRTTGKKNTGKGWELMDETCENTQGRCQASGNAHRWPKAMSEWAFGGRSVLRPAAQGCPRSCTSREQSGCSVTFPEQGFGIAQGSAALARLGASFNMRQIVSPRGDKCGSFLLDSLV